MKTKFRTHLTTSKFRIVFLVIVLLVNSIALSSCGFLLKQAGKTVTKQGSKVVVKKAVKETREEVVETGVRIASKAAAGQAVQTSIKSGLTSSNVLRFVGVNAAFFIGDSLIFGKFVQPAKAEATIERAMSAELEELQSSHPTDISAAADVSNQIFKHDSRSFGLRLEPGFTVHSSDKDEQSFVQTFTDADRSTQLTLKFAIVSDTALSDEAWNEILQEYTAEYPDKFSLPDDASFIHGLSWSYITEDDSHYVQEWIEEQGGLIAIVQYITPVDRWESHKVQILSALKSIQWSANAVRDFILE